MKHPFVALFGIFLLQLVASCTKPDPPKPPNVVFILADDLGYSDLGCMGSDFYETPNIDRLAALGATFTNGYAACRVCSPSRASILTGKSPATHGITDWIGATSGTEWRTEGRHTPLLPPEYVRSLPAADTTLAEAFRAGGYRTFFAGKWHLGGEGSWPEDHGFEVNVGGWDKGSPIGGYFDPYRNPNLPNRRPGENLSLRLARETADFITANQDTTFLAYLSFYAVHGPLQASRERWEKYRRKALARGVDSVGFAMEDILPYRLNQDNPLYAALIEQMDVAVGIVLDTLEAQGLLDNTIIVFTSDNGGVVSGDSYSTNLAPLRGGKGYQYEGGIKVPLIVYAPGHTTAGSRPTAVATGTDFYPTLLELAGLPPQPSQHVDGLSLVPALHGDDLAARDLVWHYPHYGNQGGQPSAILRRGDWKLIHYFNGDWDALYHLPTDPSEQHDLAGDSTVLRIRLSNALHDHLVARDVRFPKDDPTFDQGKYRDVLRSYREKRLPMVEGWRRSHFDENWLPNPDWWGSAADGD